MAAVSTKSSTDNRLRLSQPSHSFEARTADTMHLTAHTLALIMTALPASIMAWECNKAQHQNACPDYSIGPACFGTMSWGHCDRGCAESVHVADGTWCSGTGVILALGVPVSTPGSQNPAPPPVPYNPGTAPAVAPNPTVGKFFTFFNQKSQSMSPFVCLTT